MPTLLNGYRAGTPPLESFLRSQVIHLLKQVAVLKLMSSATEVLGCPWRGHRSFRPTAAPARGSHSHAVFHALRFYSEGIRQDHAPGIWVSVQTPRRARRKT
ncbi:hypothetical protein Anapl_09012 [Anas platyrhynchos]|uniref:Uncharacterized protein n=1 Tax=Anas platyrhynchos TaxID=8839 RepID=R0LNG1_ANAPL|nr:hypothetical protein Anapl_09012 [Anas platyrhynchos]